MGRTRNRGAVRWLPVAIDVTPILSEYLAGNRGPDPADPDRRRRPDYGVTATLAGTVLEVVLTFRRGCAYCCYEWGCHLDLTAGKRWGGVRQRLAAAEIAAPLQLELRLVGVIEGGAEFFDQARPDPMRRGWYAFAPAAAHRYTATAMEAPESA
jgi:hypothetical protein